MINTENQGIPGHQEIEVKFQVPDLNVIANRLIETGARLVHKRSYECNLRFDTPEGQLAGNNQVLRLRQSHETRLTFKGPAEMCNGVAVRQEIEILLFDFEKAKMLLEALGYQVTVLYEKYRATYELEETVILLDELPFGNFIEIEGPSAQKIRNAAAAVGLDWDKRITVSYLALFERMQSKLNLSFRDLTFENFVNLDPRELF